MLEIVSSHGSGRIEMPKYIERQSEIRNEQNMCGTPVHLSQKMYQLRFYSQRHVAIQNSNSNVKYYKVSAL